MQRFQIKIEPLGHSCWVDKGTPLINILRQFNLEFPCGGNGRCGNCKVKKLSGEVDIDPACEKWIEKKNLTEGWILACFCKVKSDLVLEIPQKGMHIQTDYSSFDFQSEEGYGIAIDLGSTTIVLQLVDLRTSNILCTATGINPQTAYGADIISRISFALKGEEQSKLLRDCIQNFIGHKINSLLESVNVKEVTRIIIVGNTVMHHLFAGYNVQSLASAPFCSQRNEAISFTPSDLGWNLENNDCSINFLPNMSHFIGSDILGGINATNLDKSEKYSLLVDLGTNGEMALGNKKEIIYTSTAAGPAFEGINISCGMRATSGAVFAVDCIDHNYDIQTIGNIEAQGLCGSGLIEAVECLLQEGKIDFTGAITENDCNEIHLSPNVSLTINDIREFQLAKAALATGIELLLESRNLQYSDIDKIYLTGGLGNYLNLQKTQNIGLFNGFKEEQIHKMRNAALTGCRQFLFKSNQNRIFEILNKCEFRALESDTKFQEIFCEQMFFPLSE